MTEALASLFDRSAPLLAALAGLDAPARHALAGLELALALVASGGAHPDLEQAGSELGDDALFRALDPESWLVIDDDASDGDDEPDPGRRERGGAP